MRSHIFILLLALTQGLPAQSAKNPVLIFFPDASWAVQIDSPGFAAKTDESQPNGRRYYYAINDRTQMALSITLTRVDGPATLDDCRATLDKRISNPGEFKPANVKRSQANDFTILEYIVHEFRGAPIEQENLFACGVKGDTYVDVHISKVQYSSKDEPLFNAVFKSISLVTRSTSGTANAASPASASFDYWVKGGAAFEAADYPKAIDAYQKAFDLEKAQRQLKPDYWRVLIDNLGMAYGISGKLDKAQEILRYGIAQEPTYPMFYYVLACIDAERGDMDKTMENLTTAFKYRANVIQGEKMPDPKADDSFQRFMKNEKFRKLVESF